jgi:fibronectin-binding autotransporter adhesin
MKTQSHKIWFQFLTAMVATVAGMLIIPSALANGPALYFTVADPSGTGYDMNGNYWATSESGTPGKWVESDQMTFGASDADANYPPSTVFSVDLDDGTHLNGIVVNSTNVTITLTGSANAYFDTSVTNVVNTNSTLIWDVTHDGGFNFNKQTVVFAGGGTNDFEDTFGGNESSGSLTENMVNGLGTMILAQTATGSFSQPSVGYTLNSGVLDFATGFAAANAFDNFGANLFTINGGSIDNTSGSAQTLTVGSGGYSIGGDFAFIGSANLDFGTAPLALTVSPTITVSSNTLAIDGNISDGGSGYGITKAGAGTLAVNGTNTYSGPTVVNGGTLAFGALGSFPVNAASVTVNAGATLDVSGAAPVALGSSQTLNVTNAALTVGFASPTTAITTPTLAVGGTTNVINVANLPVGVTFPLQVPVISYTTLTGTLNFGLGTMPGPGYTAYISNNVANSSVDLVVVSGPVVRALTWSGATSGAWDTTTANWLYQGSSTTYNPGDLVRFDDTAAGQTSISLTKVLSPGALTVSNDTHTYNLGNGNSGGGYISGPISLEKDGTGLLILDDGGNNFSGGVNINAGTVQVGNNDGHGYLGSGPVADDGALVFDSSGNDANLSNSISGPGTVTQEGGDTLQLAGANTFTGVVLVTNNSTLQLGSAYALGGNPAVTIAKGSTLDVNGLGVGTNTVTVSGSGVGGNGVIVNSGAEQDNAMQFVTLAGDTTFGGSGRWDIRSGAGGGALSTGGNPYNLTKTGANQVSLVSVVVDPALGNVDVQQGSLALQENTTGLGNPADTLTVESGASLEFYKLTNELDKVITLVGSGSGAYSISNDSGANVILGPVTLSGDCSIVVNGTSLALDGSLTGGQLTKDGSGTLIINGTGSNAGITADTGELMLNGTYNGPITCNSLLPATFAGSGTNSGTTELAGAFYPGDSNVVGTITLSGLTLDSGATVGFDLGTTNTVGGGVNDLIQVNGNLTINGNLVVINPMGLLEDGVPYRFANYTGTLTMNGGLSVSGPEGYTFTVDTSTPHQINLVPSGGPPVWNGGSLVDSDWSDPANWNGTSIASGDTLYFAGNNRLTNTNDTPAGTTYGDIDFNAGAGAFVLNGNPIGLGGNVNNHSAHLQTVNVAMAIGQNSVFNAGTAGLVLEGGITNTSIIPYTIDLQGSNGTLAGSLQENLGVTLDYIAGASNSWSMVGNNTSYLTNLTVAGNSMTFGTGSDSPSLAITNDGSAYPLEIGTTTNVTSVLTINSGTLTVENSSEQPLEMGALGSTGIINVNGGTLNITGTYIQIGDSGGTGIINQSGGTVNAEASGDFILGNQTNAAGILNISGGTFNIPDNAYVGFRGAGIWNISSNGTIVAGTVNMTRNHSDAPNASGTINLNSGGTLVMDNEAMGNAATGQTGAINFNGGLLTAAADSTSFISPPASPSVLTATVQAGGAIINDGGYAITISQPLVHDSALGTTTDGGLTKQGSGTLTLAATNGYTGNTTVNAGILEIAQPTLAASSTVLVTNGATLQLDFAVTNTVAGLVLGGESQPEGVYNAGTSPSYISGSGSLLVVSSAPAAPTIGKLSVSGGKLAFTVTGGNASTTLYVLTSTNLALPLADWTPVTTNQFDSNGSFSFTNSVSGQPKQFFIIQEQ